jgi:hypothetical protein
MSMPGSSIPVEQAVEKLTKRQLTTRQIAAKLPVSQSTVVRIQHRLGINGTGPQPALPAARVRTPERPRVSAAVVAVTAALLILAASAAAFTWARLSAPAPAPVCVRYSTSGDVTGLAAAGNGCPAGWTVLILSGP